MTGRGIMTLKEEYFATIVGHEKTEHVMADMGGRVAFLGGRRETFENGPMNGGLDGFGIKWEGSESASGQPVPSPGSAILHDIEGILKKYGKQIAVIGGYDTNGLPGQETASYEVIENEVRRCLETYAPYGSYSFFGFRIMNSADPMAFFEGLRPIHEAFRKLTQ